MIQRLPPPSKWSCPRRLREWTFFAVWVFTAIQGVAVQATDKTAPLPKSIAELKQVEAKVEKMVSKVLPCIVAIRIGSSQGSGVIVSADGYVMTAGHVVGEPGKDATVIFADGKTAKGKTLGVHRRVDAGLLKITDSGKWPFLEKGHSSDLPLGTWTVAVGHPLGYQKNRPPAIRVGRLLHNHDTVMRTDCTLVAGDSGGPLLDLDARVIGINSRIAGPTNMNFHVPVDIFHDTWDRLIKGETWMQGVLGKDSSEFRSVLRNIVAGASNCVVRIQCNGKDTALGTIVGPNGWILTKASDLKKPIVCLTQDTKKLDAQIVGIHEPFDLAMLKVDATGLPNIAWNKNPTVSVGQWVATLGMEDGLPMAIGVVSVPRRSIPPTSGVLGIMVENADGGVKITKVLPKTPAEKVGLRQNDLITHINDKPAGNQHKMVEMIKSHRVGEKVKLKLRRGDKEMQIEATLGKVETPGTKKRDMQNRSNVGVSRRRDNFAQILQHDTVVRPVDCGSPLVGLDGKVIGLNIARGGRTETYTVPSDIILGLMYDLMSGRLAPPKPEEKKPEEKKPEEKKPEEKKPEEKKPEEKKPEEKKPEEKKPEEKKPEEKKPEEKKPEEKKPEEKKPEEKKPEEKKPEEKKPEEKKPEEKKPEEQKPEEQKPEEKPESP